MTFREDEHLSERALVDYFAGDLPADEETRAEAHLMACASCTRAAERLTAVTRAIQELLPTAGTPELLERLRRRGLRIEENPMNPGEDKRVVLGPHLDVLVHRLLGMPKGVTEASMSIRALGTDAVISAEEPVPVDPESGAVLVLCQEHYSVFPHDIVARVRARDSAGKETVHEYTLRHEFLPPSP